MVFYLVTVLRGNMFYPFIFFPLSFFSTFPFFLIFNKHLGLTNVYTHWKRLMLGGGLGAGGKGDDRGWDGWMASLTRWTWVGVNSGSWWWTGRPGVLRFMRSQRVGHDWATELNWTECIYSDKDPSLRLSLALMQWNLGEQFLPPSPGHLTNSGNSSVVTIQECRGGSTIGNIMGRA